MSGVPDSHDARSPFTFELTLSKEPATGFSYTTLRNHALRVTGGEVTRARRLAAPSNTRWEITVRPTSDGDIVIVLPATQDCGAQGAICTADSSMLSRAARATVPGQSLPSPWCDASPIEELIEMARAMSEASARGEQLGLNDDELACYDALETNDSAVQVLGDETLRAIARELVDTVRKNVTIDWTLREHLRRHVRRILRRHGYPPDKQEQATQTVLEQAEVLSEGWAAA